MEESRTLLKKPVLDSMDFFQNRYYYLSRFFMILVGQWPYDRSIRRFFQQAFIVLWGLSFMNCQGTIYQMQCISFFNSFANVLLGFPEYVNPVLKLLTSKVDLDILLDTFPPFMTCVLVFIKYFTCSIKANTMRELLDHIKQDWSVIRVWGEQRVLEKYAEESKFYVLAYLIFIYSGIAVFINIQLLPNVLDTIFPLNESRPHKLPFDGEYFLDKEQYFYSILIHMTMTVVVVLVVASSTDVLFIIIVVHGSALFATLGYRMEHIFDDLAEDRFMISTEEEKVLLYRRIADCVAEHRKSIDYVRGVNDCYAYSMVLQMIATLFILTFTLLKMIEALTALSKMDEALICTIHATGYIFLIYLNVLPTQMLLDTSSEIAYKIYCARWYAAPFQVQRLILIVMHKGKEAYGINAANLLTSSIEVFGAVVQKCVSYFTVLYSVRQ